jgi:hypothetical protein
MNFFGTMTLSDSSRVTSHTGSSGFMFDVAPTDNDAIDALEIADSMLIQGDTTFFQGQFLSRGDITLTLQDWTYANGTQLDATTFVDGTWGFRWFDPAYLKYSVWYRDYDTSQFSLVGYKFRDSIVEQNVGNFYAPMVVPETPGHYQSRWIYLKDYSGSYAHEVVESFTSLSKGLDAMRDYPGIHQSDSSGPLGAQVITIPAESVKMPGDDAVFGLVITGGFPLALTYNWLFNGNQIADSDKYSGTHTDTLVVHDITMADGGTFNCIVADTVFSTLAYMAVDPP